MIFYYTDVFCSHKVAFYFFMLDSNDRSYGHLAVCGSIRCRTATKVKAGAKTCQMHVSQPMSQCVRFSFIFHQVCLSHSFHCLSCDSTIISYKATARQLLIYSNLLWLFLLFGRLVVFGLFFDYFLIFKCFTCLKFNQIHTRR
jgi:hypothetical protein